MLIKKIISDTLQKLLTKSPKELGTQTITKYLTKDGIFSLFLGLLNPTNEAYYDLLDYAIKETVQTASKSAKDELTRAISVYSKSLLEHMSSTHPLVRYGANTSFYALLSCGKGNIQTFYPAIFNELVDGLITIDFYSIYLHVSMLHIMSTQLGISPDTIKDIDSAFKNYLPTERNGKSYDELNSFQWISEESQLGKLKRIMGLTLNSTKVEVPSFQKYMSAFEFLPQKIQLRQLDIIYLWALKLNEVLFFERFMIKV